MCEITSTREERGKAIACNEGQVVRVNDRIYKVRSQSKDAKISKSPKDLFYDVKDTEIGWKCSCPDHRIRGAKCKHIWAVQLSVGIREQVKASLVLEPLALTCCPACQSPNIKKAGYRHNKSGDLQRYACLDCSKWFSFNVGFEKMKHNPKAVTAAMQLYFSGESLRNTQSSLKLIGAHVSHQTVSNWITKYTAIMKKYVDGLKRNVSGTWRADEIYVKVKGDMKYLFALMDDETRYWIAQEVADTKFKHDARKLFHEGKKVAGKRPETLITDGLSAYHDAFNKEFFQQHSPRSQHISAIKLNAKSSTANNNKMERINGEIRDREKTMRGLKKERYSYFTGDASIPQLH